MATFEVENLRLTLMPNGIDVVATWDAVSSSNPVYYWPFINGLPQAPTTLVSYSFRIGRGETVSFSVIGTDTLDFDPLTVAPVVPTSRPFLNWTRPTLGTPPVAQEDIVSFRIFAGDNAGGAVDFNTILAVIEAGEAWSWSYEAEALANGESKKFSIVGVDEWGNLTNGGSPTLVKTVEVWTYPPLRSLDGVSYDSGTNVLTLTVTGIGE